MKRFYVWAIALAASLSFSACSNDSGLDHGFDGTTTVEGDGQVLNLCVENTGSRAAARAGRPLLSAQAKQMINQIDLFVVSKTTNQLVLKKTIGEAEWKKATAYNTGGHGKRLQIAFRNSDNQKLASGVYTIYAVGYYATGMNYKEIVNVANAPITTTPASAVAFTPTTHLTALLNDANLAAEEIFAGQVQVEVVDDGKASYLVPNTTGTETTAPAPAPKKEIPALVLNRQVAGVTGYFTNLPAHVDGQVPAKLRLVAAGKSDKLFFTSLALGETATQTDIAKSKNVINGTQSQELVKDAYFKEAAGKVAYKVYDIDLSTFFPQLAAGTAKTFADLDLDKDGYVGYKDAQHYVYGQTPSAEDLANATYGWSKAVKGGVAYNGGTTKELAEFWANPVNKDGVKQQLVAGSIFAGRFIIPFAQQNGLHTFELQLLGANDIILKSWNVQVDQPANNGLVAEGIDNVTFTQDSKLVYNIYRNHMYSMGIKASDGEIEPGEPNPDPENPDPEKPIDPTPKPEPDPTPDPEDKPSDLSNGQDLTIHVNDNWEIIHDMEID